MTGELRRLFERFRAFVIRQPLDREMDAEMEAHLEFATEENVQRGMTAEEARQDALIRFGGVAQARERHRDARGLPWLEAFFQDARYALRTLRRDRAFTLIAVAILGLGIGANVAVFSVVNTILLRPLPFRDPQQLTWLTPNQGKGGLSDTTYTVAAFEEFQRHNRSFQAVTSYQAFFKSIGWKLTGNGMPQPVSGLSVAENFFQTMGVQPIIGRLFLKEECQKGGRGAILLGNAFWRRQFGGTAGIVGHLIELNGEPVTVVGVLPETFDFGSVFSPGTQVDFYIPAVMDFWRTWGNTLSVVGRLKPGVSVAQAQAESTVLWPQLRAAHRDWYSDYATTVVSLSDHISGKLRRSLFVLWCAVGLILLIVCVNLASLSLARSAARSKEFAMRRALGAGRWRLIGQLLTESLLLSGAGAFLGLCIALAITRYVAHQGSIALPLLSSIRLDGTALGWTALITLCSGLLFGLAPGLKTSSGNLQDSLKDSGPGMSQGRRHERLRAALVISEVALACLLLVGAGLLMRSFLQVLDVDLGFQPAHAAAINIEFDDNGNAEKRGAILQNLLHRVSAIPGVESAGIADMLPLDRNRSWGLQAKGRDYRELQAALVAVVTPGYLGAVGMRLRNGRDFTWHDGAKSEKVVIVNQAAARLQWRGQDPVGRLALVDGTDTRVIGVIADARESSMEKPANPEMYLPMTQASPEGPQLVVRTRLDLNVLQGNVMGILRSMNPDQPLTEFRPLQSLVDHAVSPRRFFVLLVMSFAALGLALASLGIYGVVSYSVQRQRQEIGIRIALGASGTRVQLGVLGRTLRLAAIGIAIGTLASFGLARLIASLLYGTATTDLPTFAAAILVLAVVAMVAGYIPARRAARINPMVALRSN